MGVSCVNAQWTKQEKGFHAEARIIYLTERDDDLMINIQAWELKDLGLCLALPKKFLSGFGQDT